MNTAPVVIPTLNRTDHLKRCLSSLAKNKYASDTDIYISVDCPPSAKYEEGYKETLKYLESGIDGFRNVYVFIQEKNLGSSENGRFLYDKVWETGDRLIYTEDDNEFAPNFLEYMNGMLEKYKDDDSVYSVNGYLWPVDIQNRGEAFEAGFISAWGCGLWKNKVNDFAAFRREDIAKYLKSFGNRRKLKNWSYHVYKQALYIACDKHYMQIYRQNSSDKELRDADFIVAIYLYIKGKKVVIPYISKVKNTGHDGSGENCDDKESQMFEKQEIDSRDSFECFDVNEANKAELSVLKKYMDKGDRKSLKEAIKMILMEIKLSLG